MRKKINTEEFIKKSRHVHKGKYTYEHAVYVNNHTHIQITCPKHGIFKQTPNNHLSGQGCPKCKYEEQSAKARKDFDNVISTFKKVHNNKYDYSKVEYINNHTKICVICPVHGKFYQTPKQHSRGQGCPQCAIDKRTIKNKKNKRAKRKFNTESYIVEAKRTHGNKYVYNKTEYKRLKDKITVTCPIHGDFEISAEKHLLGRGCKECLKSHLSDKFRKSNADFIKEAKLVHRNRYNYDKTEYKGADKPVTIICPTHGEFIQIAKSHLQGHGCSKCLKSHLEENVEKILTNRGVSFIYEYRPHWLKKYKNGQSIDFYLPEYNTAIECQGIQHFEPVEHFGGEKTLILIKERDKRKFLSCKNNGINLEYIIYNENVENRINEILEKINKGE
jgi:hypothetical protein